MALTTPYARIFYVSDGITSVYSFPFVGINRDYIRVNVEAPDGTVSENVNVEVPLKPNGDLVGSITFGVGQVPASGSVIMIERITPATQDTNYTQSLSFSSQAVNFSFDKLTARIQEIMDRLNTATVGTHPFQESAFTLQKITESNQGQYLNIDFVNKTLTAGLFMEIANERFRVSSDGQNWTYLPKSTAIEEIRQVALENPLRYVFEYRIGNNWYSINGSNFVHNDLLGRYESNAHPIAAITGLQEELGGKVDKSNQPTIVYGRAGGAETDYVPTDRFDNGGSAVHIPTTLGLSQSFQTPLGGDNKGASMADLSVVNNALQTQITENASATADNRNAINAEIANRTEADANLQQQITANASAIADKQDAGDYATNSDLNAGLAGKVNVDQGVANYGKYLVVGQDGDITLGEGSGGGSEINGIRGDYCSKYGIIENPNGIIEYSINDRTITLKNGVQLICQGDDTKVQIGTDMTYDVESTSDVSLFYVDGEITEGVKFFQPTEPTDDTGRPLAWQNGAVWQFKSNNTGNVWRSGEKAAWIADLHITNGTINRIDYVGVQQLNGQTFVEKEEYDARVQAVDTELETIENNQTELGEQVATIESKIPGNASASNQLATQAQITSLETGKQDKLTAGENITIVDGVISSTGGSSLPDQTDQAGKFLTTDGTTTSWANALVNQATEPSSIFVNPGITTTYTSSYAVGVGINFSTGIASVGVGYQTATGSNSVAIGFLAGATSASSVGDTVAIGSSAKTNQSNTIAIGKNARVNAVWAIQIGQGNNSEANSFYVATSSTNNWKIIDDTGLFPSARIPIDGTTITTNESGQLVATGGYNVGDIFMTERTDTALNGAVDCNGATYNDADFSGADAVPALLSSGRLAYVSMAEYDAQIAAKGWCAKFGRDDEILYAWDGGERGMYYTKSATPAQNDAVYNNNGQRYSDLYISAVSGNTITISSELFGVDNIVATRAPSGDVGTTFRVPTLTAYIVQKENIPVVGNGMTLGFDVNSSTITSSHAGLNGSANIGLTLSENAYGTDSGTSGMTNSQNYNTVSITTDPTKSGVVTDGNSVAEMRVMVQLATGATDEALTTATAVVADVAGLKDLNNITATGKATAVGWGMPDWTTEISIPVSTSNSVSDRKQWIWFKNFTVDENSQGYINDILVFRKDGYNSAYADNVSVMLPLDVGDTYRVEGSGTASLIAMKGVQ